MTHLQTRAFFAALDWTRRDIDLASDLRTSVNRIRYWRRRLEMPPSPTPHKWRSVRSTAYANWDWSQPNSALARAKGFTRQYVHHLRQKLNQPSPFTAQRQRLAA